MLEASGLASKALSAGNKIAPLLGAYTAWTAPAGAGDLSSKMNFYVDALKGFKIANPITTTSIALGQPDRYPIAQGLGLYATGYGIELVGDAVDLSVVKSLGKIAKKGGASAAVNSLVASYIFEARNNPHSGGGGNRTSTGPSVPGRTPAAQSTIIRDNPQGLQRYMPGGNAYYAV
jgi:hypothetical protein